MSRQSRRPVLPVLLLSAVLAAGAGPASVAVSASPALAQLKGTLSGKAFVEQAAVSSLFEIEAAKLALSKSQAAPIRAFADQMIKDHEAMSAELKTAVQDARGEFTIPTQLDPKHQQMLDQLRAASTGADFEAAYARSQVNAHEAALGIFTAFARDGDQTALRDFAGRQLPVLQMHFDHAKQLKV